MINLERKLCAFEVLIKSRPGNIFVITTCIVRVHLLACQDVTSKYICLAWSTPSARSSPIASDDPTCIRTMACLCKRSCGDPGSQWRQICFGRALDDLAILVEVGAVAGALELLLSGVPVHDAVEVRADGGALVLDA